MVNKCVCYNARINSRSRRPFHGIAIRLLVSAQTNIRWTDSESVCNACPMSYLKWRNNSEFTSVLNCLEEVPNESIMETDDKVGLYAPTVIITYQMSFSTR